MRNVDHHRWHLCLSQPIDTAFPARHSRVITILIAFLLLSPGATPAHAQPASLPSVKKWTHKTGFYQYYSGARVVIAPASAAALTETASLLVGELRALTGYRTPVVVGRPRKGDISLSLMGWGSGFGNEGYSLTIGNYISIESKTKAGAFYGTRTLLQYLRQNRRLPCGVAQDWPDYPVRGLMVDVGRKYFTVKWLKNQIRDMAFCKLNALHLHLSDNIAFRIQSLRHPELNRDTKSIYTRTEIRDLIQFAKSYNVIIIPEIDLPAHCDAILRAYPELRLRNREGHWLLDKMDVSDSRTYSLTKDLLDEYLPLFPGPFWHCGADEYLHPGDFAEYPQLQAFAREKLGTGATGIDAYLYYVNWVDDIVRSHGKITRAWGDPYEYLVCTGSATGLHRSISLELWNQYSIPQEVVHQGYRILNASYDPLYYNVGDGKHNRAKDIYENWFPHREFGGEHKYEVNVCEPFLEGASFHIWADHPDAETEIAIQDNILLPVRAMALKSWRASRASPPYSQFVSLVKQLARPVGWIP